MVESLLALFVTMLAVSSFSLIVLEGHKAEVRIEKKTDEALAKNMIKKSNLKSVMVHNQIYEKD